MPGTINIWLQCPSYTIHTCLWQSHATLTPQTNRLNLHTKWGRAMGHTWMRPQHWLWTVIPASAFTVTPKVRERERDSSSSDGNVDSRWRETWCQWMSWVLLVFQTSRTDWQNWSDGSVNCGSIWTNTSALNTFCFSIQVCHAAQYTLPFSSNQLSFNHANQVTVCYSSSSSWNNSYWSCWLWLFVCTASSSETPLSTEYGLDLEADNYDVDSVVYS